jgi:cytoplasmic iron level regulating protein YaaA (DUF328/UPF0246 family)
MVVIISPSKTMAVSGTETLHLPFTSPDFIHEATNISKTIAQLSKEELAKLMSLSDKLTEQTWQRMQTVHTLQAKGTQPALFSYTGEVYAGLHQVALTEDDISYAQNHLRILSAMYGVLRPLDTILPYRLEMMTKIAISDTKNLYAFWKDKITHQLNDTIKQQKSQYLVNLASDEYTKAIHLKQINASVLTFDFFEMRNGVKKFVSFNAKRARGLMASYIIKNKIIYPDQLKTFSAEGYQYVPSDSQENHYTFTKV